MEVVEPWGRRYMELLFAELSANIANIFRDNKKRPKPFTADDFMIDWDERWRKTVARFDEEANEYVIETPPIQPDAMLAKVKQLNLLFGGADMTVPGQ